MRQMTRPIKDPAPSKWGYRWQRWMLTPGVRTGLRVGIPLTLTALVAVVWFANDANRAAMVDRIDTLAEAFRNRPEFIVTDLAISGADEELADLVARSVAIDMPVSSFDLDLEAIRAEVAQLAAVQQARVRVGEGGQLQISVAPRVPVALWRTADGLSLIDSDGVFAGTIATRADRRDLPLIAGKGAEGNIDEALSLFRSASPITDRLRGLVRRGERRWDVVLDRGQRILLPSENPTAALDRVIALAEAQDLLDRDIAVIDMRLPSRPTVKLGADAVIATRNAALTGNIQKAGQ